MAIDPNIQKVIIREYEPNEQVIKLGVDNDRFHVMLQGKVEIRHSDNKVRLLKDGDVFGIEYYYLNNPYSITATTVTRSRIASYHVSMIREIIYDHPRLANQLMSSLANQLEQTTLFLSKVLQSKTSVAVDKAKIPEVQIINIESEPDLFNFHDDILKSFITESRGLIDELLSIGNSLKYVEVPNEGETKKLISFSQRLNRLIGGTASMGFEKFACLSRKTSLLASKCSEIQGITIRAIISNLNLVVKMLSECFNDLETIKEAENKIPDIELKIDICMISVGIEDPELKTQSQIDKMFREKEGEKL